MDFSMQSNVGLIELFQVVYLLLSVRLGFYINACSDPTKRKWMSTLLGLVNISVVLRGDMWHYFLSVVLTILAIILTGPKYCHIAGFFSMFSYLVAYRLTLYIQDIVVGQVLTITQSLAAMVVCGIGFEINLAYKKQRDTKNCDKTDPTEEDLLKIGFFDIFHYAFNYATVCTGPYVRYQVYSDFIKLPYSRVIRRTRISNVLVTIVSPLSLLFFVVLTEHLPTQYMFTEEFTRRGFIYQLNYSVIQWFRFRLFLYSNFGVIRCHSAVSGIGAYPVENKAIPAHGPTVNNNNFRSKTLEEAREMDLDLNTTEIIELQFETLPTITEATRCWNKCVQYWLGIYIYKTLPRKLGRMGRVFLTLIVSWLWHGIYPSMLISCINCAYYYSIEALYINLQKQLSGKIVTFMNVVFWISRQYFWSWAMITYLFLDTNASLEYYKLTYFAPLVFTVFMHILYLLIFSKFTKQKIK